MKRKEGFYIQLSRNLFYDPGFQGLSVAAKWLYVVLCELEHKFGDQTGIFYRTNRDLSKDTGLSLPTLKRAKKELLQAEVISAWQMRWIDNETGKKSEKHVTAFQL